MDENSTAMILSSVRKVATDISVLRFVSEHNDSWKPFEPGAHVTLHLDMPGGGHLERSYTLVSRPSEANVYEIAVQREKSGRGGSAHIHDVLRPGDRVMLTGPYHGFRLHERAAHSILIAGGIGVTPIYAMARRLHELSASFDVHLAARGADRMPFLEEMTAWAKGRVTLYDTERGGLRPPLASLLEHPASTHHIYACGPHGMIRDVLEMAGRSGWQPAQVHVESFQSGPRPDDAAFTVTLTHTGRTIHVPAGSTMLDALLDEGVWASYDCRRGECSMCTVSVLEGDVDHRDVCLTAEQRTTQMCPCVSRSRSDHLVVAL